MGTRSERVLPQRLEPEFPRLREGGEKLRTLSEFLTWIENSKGLTLCQAFQPQYDWYMRAFANKENLAKEFLRTRRPADPDQQDGGYLK
jgi:hypothetical protein